MTSSHQHSYMGSCKSHTNPNKMPTWMHDINKNSPGCSLKGIFPEEWNNIALPIVDTLILMLKEIYRLDLKTDDLGKSSNSMK